VSPDSLSGEPVAAPLRTEVRNRVAALADGGSRPTLATVLASDDPADERFVTLKHEACEAVGIDGRDVRLPPDASLGRCRRAVERLSADDSVDAVFVQTPLPDAVSPLDVGERLDPRKDIDCFHPENVGRLVAGTPRFVPATAAAVARLFAEYDVRVAGRSVVVVGRSDAVGKPLATLLARSPPGGDATVTTCHSHTDDLASHTRRADVLVTACGVPELVDGSMLSSGVVVVDVSANRRSTGSGVEVVGDVAGDDASETASAITPVPGGVGPVTVATLLRNVVLAAERRAEWEVDHPGESVDSDLSGGSVSDRSPWPV
jgi:methylenetetrahydrofolate dehydrogenase (NADP+)/methenyltetrahydrofolate cyclohydrolase